MKWADALAYSPYAFGLVATLVAVISDAFLSRRVAIWSAAAFLAAGGVTGMLSAWFVAPSLVLPVVGVGGVLSSAPAIVLLGGALALAGGGNFLEGHKQGGPTAVLISVSALTAAVAAASTDIVATFIALEATALCAYALVAGSRNRLSDEAALKYFIQGAVAASLFVLGITGVLAVTGSTSLVALSREAQTGLAAIIGGVVLLLVALTFKSGAFPFHSWMPDAYESAPAQATAFLSSGPKTAAIAALALLAAAIGAPSKGVGVAWESVTVALAIGSIVFGNLAALRQRSYTRMLAYSGIAQAGYALVALSAFAGPTAVIMIATYALASSGAFMAAQAVRSARPDWDGSVRGMRGLGRPAPLLSAAIAVAMLSLTGVPPLFGFWGKFEAFGAAVVAGSWWLALIGVVGSVVSFGYYGAVLRAVYFEAPESPDEQALGRSGSAGVVTVLIAVAVLALGVLPLVIGSEWLSRIFRL